MLALFKYLTPPILFWEELKTKIKKQGQRRVSFRVVIKRDDGGGDSGDDDDDTISFLWNQRRSHCKYQKRGELANVHPWGSRFLFIVIFFFLLGRHHRKLHTHTHTDYVVDDTEWHHV